MAGKALLLCWVVMGMCECGARGEKGMCVTLESVDGRALYVELLEFGEREVQVRTAEGKVLQVKYELLSETSQAVLEQLDGSEAWFARKFPMAWKVRRDQATREARIATLGGDLESEEAILKARQWLKKMQNADGSWGPKKVAYTGLALQCFSGRGITLTSKIVGGEEICRFRVGRSMPCMRRGWRGWRYGTWILAWARHGITCGSGRRRAEGLDMPGRPRWDQRMVTTP